MVARNAPHRAGNFIEDVDADYSVRFTLQSDHTLPQANLSSQRGYASGDLLPHLPRSEFGIQESLYQAGFRVLLRGVGRAAKRTRDRVRNGFGNRQSFDALRTPFRGNLSAGDAPDLFGIVL